MTPPRRPSGQEPIDPATAGMRQLTCIAGTYASTCGVAASFGGGTGVIGMIAVAGLAHAVIASRHGIKRSEQGPTEPVRTPIAEAGLGKDTDLARGRTFVRPDSEPVSSSPASESGAPTMQ